MRDLRYRSDIDGLRALAVAVVVLFHLRTGVFGGGYVGVDVFFVISGFLITGVIDKEVGEGCFSILAFYERRARRILPALFLTTAAVVVVGWFLFLPDEYRELGSRVVAVAAFASNLLFWRQADYFAGPVDMEPLLHTWSLAVEEQFYIVWPLLLLVLARFGGAGRARVTRWVVTGGALVSFALSVALIDVDRTGDYYLLPTRAWELAAGAMLALGVVPPVRGRGPAEVLAAAGLALILASAVLLGRTSVFPGVNALWPVLGSALLIHADTGHVTRVGRVLGARPMVAIGLISYSLYLIHWPIIVFVKYQLLRDPTPLETLAMLVAMIGLAWLSWRFVERPFRNRHRFRRWTILGGSAVAIMVLVAAGLVMFRTNGLPFRFPGVAPRVVDATHEEANATCFLNGRSADHWSGTGCFLVPPNGGPNTLLWGDSHANQYREVFRQGMPVRIPGLLLYATSACLPVFDVSMPQQPDCRGNNDRVARIIRDYHVGTVVLSGDWEYNLASNHVPMQAVAATVARLHAMGVRVKVIGDNPFYPFANPGYLGYRLGQRAEPRAPYFTTPSNDWSTNPQLRAIVGDQAFFDPMAVLCRAADRQCLVYLDGQLVMEDTGHLSLSGRRLVAARMREFLTR